MSKSGKHEAGRTPNVLRADARQPVPVTCPRCGGLGTLDRYPRPIQDCPRCHGDGEVLR